MRIDITIIDNCIINKNKQLHPFAFWHKKRKAAICDLPGNSIRAIWWLKPF